MYLLITCNNVSNSPIREFGTNEEYFQIVLQKKDQYKKVLELIKVPNNDIDALIGKITIPLSDSGVVTSTMIALFDHKLIDQAALNKVLKYILDGNSKEISGFFNKYLDEKIGTTSLSSYPLDRDGGLNPALKIYEAKNQNKIDDGRWEIFVLLKNESGKVEVRSGIKSETWDYDNLNVTEQFNFSSLSSVLSNDLKQRLLKYRSGHPSLALDFKRLDRGTFQTLPVFAGGWLIRNDQKSEKRLQVYWSSGRYGKELSSDNNHLLQLCVAFNLMAEYGDDVKVEFYQYQSITMEDFITKKASNEKAYDLKLVLQDVLREIRSATEKSQDSEMKESKDHSTKSSLACDRLALLELHPLLTTPELNILTYFDVDSLKVLLRDIYSLGEKIFNKVNICTQDNLQVLQKLSPSKLADVVYSLDFMQKLGICNQQNFILACKLPYFLANALQLLAKHDLLNQKSYNAILQNQSIQCAEVIVCLHLKGLLNDNTLKIAIHNYFYSYYDAIVTLSKAGKLNADNLQSVLKLQNPSNAYKHSLMLISEQSQSNVTKMSL